MLEEKDRDILLLRSRFLKQRDYWTKKLAGEYDITGLLFEFDKHSPREMGKKKIDIEFPMETVNRILKISRGSDLSIYIFLLAALKALIFRYTSNHDIIVISPINRQELTGDTINSLVFIRDSLDSEAIFKEIVLKIRATVLEAYENQDYPYDKLLEYVFPSPVGQEINKNMPSDILCSLSGMHNPSDCETAAVGLSFNFHRENDRISGHISVHSHTCRESEAMQLSNHFIRLLTGAVENPDTKISALPLLSEKEKKILLEDFNRNSVDFPDDKTVHHFIRDHAEKNPHATALAFNGEEISYSRLNSEAGRLAVKLQECGIGPDQTVGILMERSPQMVNSILAVWKAGAAYIPLDVDYPHQRIREIMDDSKTGVLITSIDISLDRVILNPDDIAAGSAAEDIPGAEDLKTAMNTLSYVIYTSGSTGKPKGAMVEHIGMMNHIDAKIRDLQITGKSIVAQNASHTFDISVWQFFAALIVGGKTVIYPADIVLEPDRLLSRVTEDRVTVLEVVPSYLTTMLELAGPHAGYFEDLEYLLVTGETVKPRLVDEWFGKYPGIKMVNAYGPTEASDDITHFIMDAPPGGDRIPIGRPVQNFNIYIVDNHMNLCPIGVIGEIWVSGIGVGRGYLNDEDKTKKAFIRDPFIETAEIRLYKTGDLGRRLIDGTIEFFGRKDHQVKIRGFRIELEEIENRLLCLENVKTAAAAPQGEGNNTYLCAYIVPASSSGISAREIKEKLAAHLPYYMVPSHYIFLEELPLTPNGKIDRKALPAPGTDDGSPAVYIAPRSGIEKKLAEIWTDVLDLNKPIGIDDNFFELGGQSLLATLMMAGIFKKLGVKITLADIFKTPTIRGLAQCLPDAEKGDFESILPTEEKEYYPLSPEQKRIYVVYRMDQNNTHYNMTTIVELEGVLHFDRLEEVFRTLLRRHESFRTSFDIVNKEPVQRIHPQADFDIENFEASNPAAIFKRIIRPFDLSRAPLLRVGLIRSGEFNHLLSVDMHHIISDGVSLELLVKEFITLYSGKTPAPVKLRYRDYSEWRNSPHVRAAVREQEKYWLKEFEKEVPLLDFPIDYPRPAVRSFEGDSIGFTVNNEETSALRTLALKEEATLFMVLLAIYTTMLSRLTASEDIVVGTGIAGRRHSDLNNIIGMFVNTLALRSFPGRDKTFRTFLAEIKEKTTAAFENQDYQFEDLVEKVVPNRDFSRNPLFDTAFVYEKPETGTPGIPAAELPGLTVKPYRGEHKVSRFDMTFFVTDMDEQLEIGVEYTACLFKKETVQIFADYFRETVSEVLSDNEILLGEIAFARQERKENNEVPKYEFTF